MNNAKTIFASKTFWLNILGALIYLLGGDYIHSLIPPDYYATLMMLLNILNRFLTNGPVTITPKAANKLNR